MKYLKNMLTRIRSIFSPAQGKLGSSLALVMMIGAALVIWVMCIMPLMSTAGTAAIELQGSYDDYLLSRSSIEFAKSELEKIVEQEIPYTFAVVRDGEQFLAVKKKDGPSLNSAYTDRVNSPNSLDDKQDVPSSSDLGNAVTAICAVTRNVDDPNVYDITITTFHNGEKGIVYTATFTPRGSLLIYPEAYKQSQALPLSDFVLVDGLMGPNQAWNSTIQFATATDLTSFSETLLPWKLDPETEYANSLGYPAVFKTPANAALSDSEGFGDPLDDGELSDEVWIHATAVSKSASKTTGNVWIEVSNYNIKVYLQTTEKVDITSASTIYVNGKVTADKKVPNDAGYYQISVDYTGTDYTTADHPEKYDESKVNVLPFQGMQMPDVQGAIPSSQQQNLDNVTASIEKITRVDHEPDPVTKEEVPPTYDVTLKLKLTNNAKDDNILYGYFEEGTELKNGKYPVNWQSSNVIRDLEAGKTYYFYICRAAAIVDGKFYTDSEVKNAGMIFPAEFVTQLSNGSKYVIMGGDGNPTFYPLSNSKDAPAYTLNEGYIVEEPSTLSAYTWTASQNGSYWRFQNSNGTFLDLTAEEKFSVAYTEKSEYYTDGFLGFGAHYCYKATVNGEFINPGVSFTGDGKLTVTRDSDSSDNFVIRKDLTAEEPYDTHHIKSWGDDYGACNKHSKSAQYNYSKTLFLNLNGGVSASDSSSTVKFMLLPDDPYSPDLIASPSQSYTLSSAEMTYGDNAYTFVDNHLTPAAKLDTLYINFAATSQANANLNAGKYHVIVKLNVGTAQTPEYRYAAINDVFTVKKADIQSPTLALTAQRDENDELTVNVTCDSWDADGGQHYFGYKKLNDPEDADYHWFPSDEDSYTFRLIYGEYVFSVMESGTRNFNGLFAETAESLTIEPKRFELSPDQKNEFIFAFDKDTHEVIWYRLPTGLLPSRVHLVYGIPSGEDDIIWTETYSSEVRFYGAVIPNTDFGDLDHVLQLSQPVGITNVNGHTSSMMRGSSLYFMGQSNSINTYGNSIYLTTDLLVLYKDITGGGKVFVEPYSIEETDPGDTLLFVADPNGIVRNGETIFEGRQFYRIPKDTDLCNLSASRTINWKIGSTTDNNVKYLFRQNVFPDINLDVAYASKEQLSRILSSETIGWTNLGVLSGTDTTHPNSEYVICAYVTEMSGNVSYKANRVMVAAKATDGSNTLYVPGNLTFTTHYLSVDADQIVQVGNSSFILNNLGIDQNNWDFLGIDKYYTKTLQMDFERHTNIISSIGTVPMTSQICRYDDGTDLFGGNQVQPLMATYNPSELENLSGLFTNTIKTVDRYVSLKSDSGDDSIDFGSIIGASLKIYANYIYVDPSVKEISLTGAAFISGDMDIYVSSQESGYTTKEYLGLFQTHSAETYTGTLLYFANQVNIKYTKVILFIPVTRTKTVQPGFYYIPADPNGTSLSELADDPDSYRVEADDLKNYSIYINPDGSLSNAYVDTGIEDNSSIGAGGFSGGNME